MHESVFNWARDFVLKHDLLYVTPVLEVGSCNVNGSVRVLFNKMGYTGVDIAPGPGVDLVIEPNTLPFPDSSYKVVVSTEMLEHAEYPIRILSEMHRVLKKDGVLLLSTRSKGFEHHNAPDYHRFSRAEMAVMLLELGFDRISVTCDPQAPGVFASAFKPV